MSFRWQIGFAVWMGFAIPTALQAVVPTITLTDMLSAHERRVLRQDGILVPSSYAVTNDFGIVAMTGEGALPVGRCFIQLRDADGWAEIRNDSGNLMVEVAPLRLNAQNMLGELFGFVPDEDTPDELRLSHLVLRWEIVSVETALELGAAQSGSVFRRSARSIAPEETGLAVSNLMFTSIVPSSDSVTYTMERPCGFLIPDDLVDIYTSVNLLTGWSMFKTINFGLFCKL